MDPQTEKKKFDNLSFEIEELEQMLAELVETTVEEPVDTFDASVKISFILKFDKDGLPRIQSFSKPLILSPREIPLVEPISKLEEDLSNYVITIDLLGHEKEDIDAVLGDNFLVVMSRKNKPFYKKFYLKDRVDPRFVKKTLKNNVLEIVLKKQALVF